MNFKLVSFLHTYIATINKPSTLQLTIVFITAFLLAV